MSQSTDLVQQAQAGGLSAFLDGGPNAFTDLAMEYNVPVGDILGFSGNTGQFTYKGTPIEYGTPFVFNMMEMKKGWICWKDKKPIDKSLVSVISRQPVPAKEQLDDHGPYTREGDGWSEMMSVPVADMDGEYPQLDLGLSSRGGINALTRLASEFGSKVRMNLDDKMRPKLPVVELNAQSFEPKNVPGKKWAPVFTIVGWIGIDDMEAANRDREASAKESEPAQAAAPAPAPAPKPPAAAPAAPVATAAAEPAQAGFRQGRIGKRT